MSVCVLHVFIIFKSPGHLESPFYFGNPKTDGGGPCSPVKALARPNPPQFRIYLFPRFKEMEMS